MKSVTLRLGNGKAVGHSEQGKAVLRVERSRHFFRKIGGYSIDAGVFRQIQRSGANTLEFIDKETGEVSRVGVATFAAHAASVDFGYGPKLVCSERFYCQPEDDQMGLFPTASTSSNSGGGYTALTFGALG